MTSVPLPGCDRTSSLPPNRPTRCSMLKSPMPAEVPGVSGTGAQRAGTETEDGVKTHRKVQGIVCNVPVVDALGDRFGDQRVAFGTLTRFFTCACCFLRFVSAAEYLFHFLFDQRPSPPITRSKDTTLETD